MADPIVLDLSTDRERSVVRINGHPYLLRTATDLTIAQFRTVHRLNERITLLLAAAAPTEADDVELTDGLGAMSLIALERVEPSVIDKMTQFDRLAVYRVFTELLLPGLQQKSVPTAAPTPGRRPAGTKRSRASSGSTAATRPRGSRRSRSA